MERWRYEGFRKKFEGVMSFIDRAHSTTVHKTGKWFYIPNIREMEIKLGHGKNLRPILFFFSI